MSCYIPFYTTRHGDLQQAACGAFIAMRDHSVTPSCPSCQAWLEQDARDFAATEAATFDLPPVPKLAVPDVQAEYQKYYDRKFGGRR